MARSTYFAIFFILFFRAQNSKANNASTNSRKEYLVNALGLVHNCQTGRTLDSCFKGNVYTFEFNNGKYQTWRFHSALTNESAYYIQNEATCFYLESDQKGNVYSNARRVNESQLQMWIIEETELNKFTIQNVATRLMLGEHTNDNVYSAPKSNSTSQLWTLDAVGPNIHMESPKLTINLFGNGVVFAGVHHTLITIDYGEQLNASARYQLLEVVGGNGDKIKIYEATANTEKHVLSKRVQKHIPTKRWGIGTTVVCDSVKIRNVIDEYNGTWYRAFGFYPRNCRTFINRIFEACGSDRRTGRIFLFE